MMAKLRMDKNEIGPGERATRARRRFALWVFAGLLVFGGLIGGFIGAQDQHDGPGGIGDLVDLVLAPGVAVVAAILLLSGLVGAPLYMFSKIDELAVRRNLRGMAAGWFAVIGGFPVWFVLAAGGWLPKPTAFGVFALCYVTTTIAFAYLKWQDGALPFMSGRDD